MHRVLVSVVVATHRRKETLEQALHSLIEQDYQPLEIIVVDDNADEEWNQIISTLVQRAHDQLRDGQQLHFIVNQQNIGSARSRNEGIAAAQGELITFLDDDDVYLPTKISAQTAAMLSANADYSLMDLALINETGRLVEHKTHPYLHNSLNRCDLIRLHLLHHLTGTDAMMFRREYLLQIGGFDPIDIGDEFYLMMKAIGNNGHFAYLPQTLVRAKVHYDGSGLTSGPGKEEGMIQLYTFKKRYFSMLSKRDIRRIRMRHHAVLAFSHLKNRNFVSCLSEAAKSLLISPAACCQLLLFRYIK